MCQVGGTQFVAKRIKGLLVLKHRRGRHQTWRCIRQRSEEVHGGGQADRGAPRVRHALDRMGLRQRGDFLALCDTAGSTYIRLDDVHRALFQDAPEAKLGEFVFPTGYRHVQTLRHFGIAIEILGRNRLFEPVHVQLLELAANVDRLGHVEAMIRVDHQHNVRADRVAHSGNPIQVLLHRTQADFHLDRFESLRFIAERFLDRLFVQAIHVLEVKAGRIGLQRGTETAADQLVDRLVGGFADNVPQRNINTADRCDGHARQAVILDLVVELFPQHFNVEGIAPDDRRAQHRFDDGAIDCRRAIAIAPADGAVVGTDLDDQRALGFVEPAARRGKRLVHVDEQLMRNDFGNLHSGPVTTFID